MTMTACPVLLFDGVCSLCNAFVNFVIDHDPRGVFRFAALQSDEAKPLLKETNLSEDHLASLVLLENGKAYTSSTAALRVARRLTGPWWLLQLFFIVPTPTRDLAYDWIARNRYRWFGRRPSCRMPTPELRARLLGGGVISEAC